MPPDPPSSGMLTHAISNQYLHYRPPHLPAPKHATAGDRDGQGPSRSPGSASCGYRRDYDRHRDW